MRRRLSTCSEFGIHFRRIDHQPLGGLAAEEKVRGDAPLIDQREVLVDGRNSEIGGGARVGKGNLAAVEKNVAGVGLVCSGYHLDESRFAGAVVADKRHDLPACEREIDAAQCADVTERLGDACELKEYAALG